MYIGCLCTWVYFVLYEQLHVVISTRACVLPGQRGGHSWTPGAFWDFSNLLITQSSLKLVYEFGKDTKEGLGICGFAVFSKVGGSLAEFFHGSLLERLQRLDCRMTVFQEITHDNGKAVLRGRRHLLTSWANLLDCGMKVIQIGGDVPLVYFCCKWNHRKIFGKVQHIREMLT